MSSYQDEFPRAGMRVPEAAPVKRRRRASSLAATAAKPKPERWEPVGEERAVIVLARVVTDRRVVKEGQWDIGRPHTWEEYQRAESMMWLNDGGPEDVAKAKQYAATGSFVSAAAGIASPGSDDWQRWEVICYSVGEEDPLGRAKAEVMRTSLS